ncbi:MAG: GAF domain-containing protein [Anaerolineaceae bacterium]|nr:GAF domain-containing protein [Anaerolineaceae bacterium]
MNESSKKEMQSNNSADHYEMDSMYLTESELRPLLEKVLQYLIEELHPDYAGVFIQSRKDKVISVWKNVEEINEIWVEETEFLGTKLFQLSINPQGEYLSGEGFNITAFPIIANSSRLGYIVVSGEITQVGSKIFANQLSESIGQYIMGRKKEFSSDNLGNMILELGRMFVGLNSKLSYDEIQMKLVNGVRKMFGCEIGAIGVFDETQNDVLLKKTLINENEWYMQTGVKPGEGIIGYCLAIGLPVFSNDPKNDSRFVEEVDEVPDYDLHSVLCVPLINEDKIIGFLSLQNNESGFTILEQQLMLSISKAIINQIISLRNIQQLQVINAHLDASRWELIRSRNTLRSLIDNLPDSLYIIDRMYRLVAINSARSKRVEGVPRHLVGKPCYQALYGREEPCPNCLVTETFYKKKISHRTERKWLESGEAFEWEIDTYPIFDETGGVIQVILVEKDVTDKRRIEGSLAQSEKMAAVGQLAAGIAHEINNPLTVILANAQILQRELPEENDWLELVEMVHRAGSRALHSVRNLLDFARKEQLDFVPTEINDTIRRALEMLKHESMKRSIELDFEACADDLTMPASPNNLQGVWVNLILNAMDASPEEGGVIHIHTQKEGKEILISIKDNGHGISNENLNRIFEPFYTTKGQGHGTGLGLSHCHRVVKQHGGHILVDSEVGKGTTFTVVFPIYQI